MRCRRDATRIPLGRPHLELLLWDQNHMTRSGGNTHLLGLHTVHTRALTFAHGPYMRSHDLHMVRTCCLLVCTQSIHVLSWFAHGSYTHSHALLPLPIFLVQSLIIAELIDLG